MAIPMRISGREVWRDFVTDGVPSSGPNHPKKSDIRTWSKWVEDIITAIFSGGGLIYATLENLNADLNHTPNSLAWVIGDSEVANNGIYMKLGLAGVGSWQRVGDLPYSFIFASNIGDGSPSAIEATTSIPVSSDALILLQIAEDYVGDAATVSFNGAVSLTIKTNSGDDVRRLAAGSVVYGVISGNEFRLANDEAIASLIYGARDAAVAAGAAAQLAQDGAEAARDIAAGYASDAISGGMDPGLSTVMGMGAITIPAGINHFHVAGYHSAGDGGGALYVKVDDEPAHAGKFQTADGAWWEIAKGQDIRAEMFGAIADGVTDNADALSAVVEFGSDIYLSGTYLSSRSLELADGQQIYGHGIKRLRFGAVSGYVFDHPTKILFTGTGSKDRAIAGATATTVANPSAGEVYLADSGTRGDSYKTNDFSAAFSAGIVLGKGSGIHNIGIYPAFDGIEGYLGSDGRLSDEWDVGVWARNSDWWQLEECLVYGHWRKAALLVSSSDLGDGKIPSNEKGSAKGCHFQGFAGLSIRSPEVVTGSNWGLAGTSFIDCDIRSLSHQSRALATSAALVAPFASPSMCMEVSGGVMRGIKWYNCTFIGPDDISVFFGKASEMFFTACYSEAQSINVNGEPLANSQGSRMIGTANSTSLMWKQNAKYAIDMTPWQRRDIGLAAGRYTAAGVFSPAFAFDDDQQEQRFASWMGPQLRAGQGWRVLDENNNAAMQLTHAGIASFATTGGLLVPNYTTAQFADATHAVNTSGKFLWKLAFNSTTGRLMRANGSGSTATWLDMVANASNTITPA